MKTLTFIASSLILIALFLYLLGCAIAGLVPNTRYITPRDAFVYPEGPNLVLVLESGSYIIQGNSEQAGGCYALKPPQAGSSHGTARWVWWIC